MATQVLSTLLKKTVDLTLQIINILYQQPRTINRDTQKVSSCYCCSTIPCLLASFVLHINIVLSSFSIQQRSPYLWLKIQNKDLAQNLVCFFQQLFHLKFSLYNLPLIKNPAIITLSQSQQLCSFHVLSSPTDQPSIKSLYYRSIQYIAIYIVGLHMYLQLWLQNS